MTSHSDNVWHLFHYTRHHILALWHQATIFMTSHPLYLTWYPLYLCHHIHWIDDITPTQFMRSHLLYMTTSYPFYMTSQPLNVCHHNNSFYYITPFACRTSNTQYVKYHTLYKAPHPHLMISHHIIYDITCTVFITSPSLYLKWPLHICVITTSLLMVSDQLYVWHHKHFTYAIVWTLHNVTSTIYDFTPL